MLTIQKPLKLTARASILQLNENFTERMRGNYRMIESGLTPEDMLHFLSAPPEVYVSEGEGGSLVDFQNTFHNQDIKIEVINDVLNRILVSDTYPMTYQDQTFIQSMLRKMGVTNVQEFMNQFRHMRKEIKNVSHLTELYESGQELISQIQEYREHTEAAQPEPEAENQSSPAQSWLYQEIFNRLRTEHVYEDVRSYLSANMDNSSVIHRLEMQVSQQTITRQNLTLNRLQNELSREDQPLVYHYQNIYEFEEEGEITNQEGDTVNRFNEAVLLNSLNQMYALRSEELSTTRNVWYQLADSVYQTAENTFRRMEENENRYLISKEAFHQYSQSVEQHQKEEIQALEQLFTRNTEQNSRIYENINRYGDTSLIHPEVLPGMEAGTERSDERTGDKTSHSQEIVTRREVHQITKETKEELLKHQLDIINQQNLERYTRLQELRAEQEKTEKSGQIDRRRAMTDGLRAIENPEEVLLTYLEHNTETQTERIQTNERLRQIIGSEGVQVLETLEQLQKGNTEGPLSGMTGPAAQIRFIRDIARSREEAELVHRQEAESHHETVIREVQKEIERTEAGRERARVTRRDAPGTVTEEQLVHRQNETVFDEEFFDELKQQMQTNRIQTRESHETVRETRQVQEIVNNRVNELRLHQNEDLERIISQNVSRQLGSLSEQVYGRLEKRMDAERRRRGL